MPSKVRGKCNFTTEMSKELSMFVKSKLEHEVECLTCNKKIINISNKGRHDIMQHVDSEKHKKNVASASKTNKLNEVFPVKNCKQNQLVYASEATLAYHTVVHHFSYNSTDCTNRLIPKLFQDSKIASEIQCGKTKTQAIVDNVIAPHSLEIVCECLDRTRFVGVCTDGSGHGATKLFPVIVQFFDRIIN